MEKSPHYREYRRLLLGISHLVTPEELKDMVFLCANIIAEESRKVLKEDAREFLLELEKTGKLGLDNLEKLIALFEDVKRLDLVAKIGSFQLQRNISVAESGQSESNGSNELEMDQPMEQIQLSDGKLNILNYYRYVKVN
jgi:hypothetical protein